MHKLRAETRNRNSYNSQSDEPSASQAQGVRSVVNQDGECFAQPRASQRVDVFIPTAVLRVCRSTVAVPRIATPPATSRIWFHLISTLAQPRRLKLRYGSRSQGSQSSEPHLEDSSVYREKRPTRLDKIKNFHLEAHLGPLDLRSGFPVWREPLRGVSEGFGVNSCLAFASLLSPSLSRRVAR